MTEEEKDIEYYRPLKAQFAYYKVMSGLTRKEIAYRMGVSKKNVKRLEKELHKAHLSTVRRYCMALGVVVFHRVEPLEQKTVEKPLEVLTYPLAWCLGQGV